MRALPGFLLLLAVAIFVGAVPARADSWAPPGIGTYVSANGQYRLTVLPREIGSQLAYFEAKARGETLPELEGPLGRFEKLEDGQWVSVWSRALLNEVAPVKAIVSDDGRRVVTFDNWHAVGHGDHVVVLYGADGALVRSLRLDQIVPSYFVEALPASVSSISWREGDPRFVGNMLELAIAEPRSEPDITASFHVRVALTDGAVEPIAPAILDRLTPLACAIHGERVRGFNNRLAFERADLVYPASTERDDDWQRYLHHAVERLKPLGADAGPPESDDPLAGMLGETMFELLSPGEYMEEDFRDDFRAALIAPASQLRRRWFAALDQNRMTVEIERAAKAIKPGQMAGVDMYFLADAVHWPQIHAALAPSGARLVQVNTEAPIPPHPEDIAGLPSKRRFDPSCVTPSGLPR